MNKTNEWLNEAIAQKLVNQLTPTTFSSNVLELNTPGGDIYGLGEKFAYTTFTAINASTPVDDNIAEPAVTAADIPMDDSVADEKSSVEKPDLQAMSKKELDLYAASIGIELDARKSKAAMIAAIEA